MKRYLYVITLAAVIALSGCSSQGSSDSRDDSSNALISADNVTEIARVTGEVTPEDTTKPPQIMVEYSGDGGFISGYDDAHELQLGRLDCLRSRPCIRGCQRQYQR